ncbi:MAG: acyl-CoA thioesterase [Deltaproteobacteria bacterium]|nr:acyl-CoA thioesterase [Deltaproteobacteria bacterium]
MTSSAKTSTNKSTLGSKLRDTDFEIPADAITSTIRHRVNFHETDAMGIVHHANFIRFLEQGRIGFIAEHHRPYTEFIASGNHFAVTHVSCQYQKPARFYEWIDIRVALRWVRGASLCFLYELRRDDDLLVTAITEHALVDDEGRVRRIPRDLLDPLRKLVCDADPA